MRNQCNLEQYNSCCCTCRYRVNDWSHPVTDGESIMRRRGYICANPELGHYSGWKEHGMCEVWTPRPEVKTEHERQWFEARYGVREQLILKGEQP